MLSRVNWIGSLIVPFPVLPCSCQEMYVRNGMHMNECMAPVAGGGATSWVIDEFGNGELTPYGANVPQFCVSVC